MHVRACRRLYCCSREVNTFDDSVAVVASDCSNGVYRIWVYSTGGNIASMGVYRTGDSFHSFCKTNRILIRYHNCTQNEANTNPNLFCVYKTNRIRTNQIRWSRRAVRSCPLVTSRSTFGSVGHIIPYVRSATFDRQSTKERSMHTDSITHHDDYVKQ